MTRKEKTKIIEGLEERLNSIDHFYIVNAEGLNVKAINDFRRRCLSGGIVYKVVKNTLMRMAFEKLDLDNEVDYTIFKEGTLHKSSLSIFISMCFFQRILS